ncbi:allantoate deiminase [Gracilibacillus thailandensis]|uniref:Allantoate deiminase n=1 Tax=Gracilibacillus thailandensis TaxID=563735 RepID=A0A6N7QV42_9BACI|nr:allantoate deiminase [Gracilibacillus thailandensis]MRI64811.1 allantoate deiminase [Gracilibacillus thailandensis]
MDLITEKKTDLFQIRDVETLVNWLASFGQSDTGGANRLLYSEAWLEAQLALKNMIKANGFTAYFDSVGNLFGRLEGTKQKDKTILTGSHIDTVIDGGKYDGVFGIIASFLATKILYQKYGRPHKTIEIVSLCEEEGSRFPLTFWGSGNITGKYTLKDALSIKDTEGISLATAMKKAGFDPAKYRSPQRKDIDAFIEMHVEQGLVLDYSNTSIGAVDYIVGQRRFTICIKGESNHAGTTPMPYRKDAISLASQYIYYLTEKAKRLDKDLVVTVGKINAKPNVPNVIAGEVEFSLDVRHYNDPLLDQYCDDLIQYFTSISEELDMPIDIHPWMKVKPVAMDPKLTLLSKKVAIQHNISVRSLVSGAGHDAQVFGEFCPTALLFVPSQKGISHSPMEFTKKEDLENGVHVLINYLYELAYT